MRVTGVLSISNGVGLEYPFPLVIRSLLRLCDNVIVGVDPIFPKDRQEIESWDLPGIQLVDSVWDRCNRDSGTEIAIQMDKLVSIAHSSKSDWVVVMQADELLHDSDFPMLLSFMDRYTDRPCIGFSTERVYYWKDLNHVRLDWGATLVRIFKPNAYSFLAEGTSKDGMYAGPVVSGEEIALPYKIHHYSRVDTDTSKISRRIRNLDTFFHTEESLVSERQLPKYDFVTRNHDNFSVTEPPSVVKGNIKECNINHPVGVSEWFEG